MIAQARVIRPVGINYKMQVFVVLVVLSCTCRIAAAQDSHSAQLHSANGNNCNACHTCPKPTAQDSCLPVCTRQLLDEAASTFSKMHGPEGVILLDMLKQSPEGEDRLGPVPFDHSGHATMANISGGCAVCHHYTPEGAAHPACHTCHAMQQLREDISKPSLKGAYHRQCMGCHREWAHETDCKMCHLSKVGKSEPADVSQVRTYMAAKHPPIPEPEFEIYKTDGKPGIGSQVIFRHREHIHRYGFQCVECHRGDSCLRCHENGKKHTQKVRSLEEHHAPCSACHDTNAEQRCNHCHWEEGKTQPAPFDHASTGWPLSRYHQNNNCRACHKEVKFVRLDKRCVACHSDWNPEDFNHSITGQELNETHTEIDCEECHRERLFEQPPSCDECHDAEDGISFPDKRPGPRAKAQDTGAR